MATCGLDAVIVIHWRPQPSALIFHESSIESSLLVASAAALRSTCDQSAVDRITNFADSLKLTPLPPDLLLGESAQGGCNLAASHVILADHAKLPLGVEPVESSRWRGGRIHKRPRMTLRPLVVWPMSTGGLEKGGRCAGAHPPSRCPNGPTGGPTALVVQPKVGP
jgi:hypothetical protein